MPLLLTTIQSHRLLSVTADYASEFTLGPLVEQFLFGLVLSATKQVLVLVDGSECSRRALTYAVDIATARSGTLDVVHFTDVINEATDEILKAAEAILGEADVKSETEVVSDVRVSEPRSSTHIGRRILNLVDDREYDQVVMGHHGTGVVGELILGSTAKNVIGAGDVPVTVVP